MAIKIGSAPDSWGVWFPSDPKQTPWTRYLDEVVEAGYEWTELGPYGYLPTDVNVLRAELDQRGLKCIGQFAMASMEDPAIWPELERQVRGACTLVGALGGKYLVLIDDTYTNPFTGELLTTRRLDADNWQRLVETANRVGQITREEYGLRTAFHPHAETHVEYEDQIEVLLAQTDPNLVGLCLDTGHHAYRGGDPIAFMRQWHHRIPYLHLKSVDRDVQKRVEREIIPFGPAVGQDMFVEPSTGAVDFIQFRDVLREVGYDGWATVEQDLYPAPFDKPLPIAKRTRQYLREIGLG